MEKSIKAETTETSTKPETREEPRQQLANSMTVTERECKNEAILQKAGQIIKRESLAGKKGEFDFVVSNRLGIEVLPAGDKYSELRSRNEKIHRDLTRAKQSVTMVHQKNQ